MDQPKTFSKLYRLIDMRQPEVKWSTLTSILLEALFLFLSLHKTFIIYEDDICNLILYIIAGLIGFIGVAVAGIAIIITLFTSEQIKLIDRLESGAFDQLLYDFKWFSLIAAIETVVFIALIFVIRSPYPVADQFLFYIVSFILAYSFFYLLFYGSALIGNFIKLSHLKCKLDSISDLVPSTPISAIELQLDFLVAKFLNGDPQKANIYYKSLIDFVSNSQQPNSDELVKYLKKRYKQFYDQVNTADKPAGYQENRYK